jgi:hypothetical protein
MKIDDKDLKALYRAQVESQRPSSRRDCPSAKELLGLLRSQLSEEQATVTIDHLSRCGGCAGEFRFLSEVLRSEKALTQDIGQWLPGEKPEGRQPRDQGDVPESGEGRPSFFSRFSWRPVLVLAGLFVIGFMISVRLIFQTPETYRTDQAARVELLQPLEKPVARSSLVFKWRGVANSEYYILQLFDQALERIWQSGQISGSPALLPADLTAKLENNSSYFWMITAHTSNGRDVESRLEEFVVKD